MARPKRAPTTKRTTTKRTRAKQTGRTRKPAKRTGARKNSTRQAARGRYDMRVLAPLIEAARRGDVHAILGVAPGVDLRAALATPPAWGDGSYEKLLALYVACARDRDVSGIIYDFAEHTFFRHDDDGYGLAQVNTDLAELYATHPDLADHARALEHLEAALAGPYPYGVKKDLDPLVARIPALRRRLAEVTDDDSSS